jgi:hypothetical protein
MYISMHIGLRFHQSGQRAMPKCFRICSYIFISERDRMSPSVGFLIPKLQASLHLHQTMRPAPRASVKSSAIHPGNA